MLEKSSLQLPPDGRQSATAISIARGARRMLRAFGYSTLTELTLASGRRADIIALAGNAEIHIVEIKSSLADFRADQKWPQYRDFCDRFYFAIAHDFPREIIPAEAGLILADSYGAEIQRLAPEHRLAPARRRAVMLRFAQVAADRLHSLGDPDNGFGSI
jgi:hypothetical protein